MKVLLNVTVGELEDKINRQIIVDENINLSDLCEYIIVSMDGKKIPLYELEYDNLIFYPLEIKENEYQKSLLGLTLKDLKLKKDEQLCIKYSFDKNYYFNVNIDNFIKQDNDNKNIDFKVLSGKGYGIIDDKNYFDLIRIFTVKRKDFNSCLLKSEIEYLNKTFDNYEVNERINNYIKNKENKALPKKYIFNVSLEGFNKEIKRKISVNNDITIDRFCEKVILSMNGDLSHSFDIKIGKEYFKEYYGKFELFNLNLHEKQRLKIIYDLGDNWQFNLTLSKITDDYDNIEFEVLSGKGYGIIDDCGGTYGLYDIFYGGCDDWGNYDINEFDIKKCNEKIKKV